jgi:hypothetical protein
MKRREFFKSSVIASAAIGVGSVSALNSCDSKSDKHKNLRYLNNPQKETKLQQFENNFLKVEIYSNAVIRVLDKQNNQHWETLTVAIQDETTLDEGKLWTRKDRAMGEQYPGRFDGKKEGDNLRFTLFERQNLIQGEFLCRFDLENEWLKLQILEVDDSIPSLVFPPPFNSDELVLPIGSGTLFKKTESNYYQRQFLQCFSALTMRFIAGMKQNNGWMAIFDYHTANVGALLVNSQIAPAWVRSMGKWHGNYTIRYGFTTDGYVGIAKRYRKYAQENGLFKSLKEKTDANPNLQKLLGGRALQFMQMFPKGNPKYKDEFWFNDQQFKNERGGINFTFKQVMKKVELAKNMGFNKGMILLRGWIKNGYDASHPDILPPDPALGTIEELKEVMHIEGDYIKALHDNYQDFYDTTKSFPRGVNVRPDGKLMSGGLWGGGNCYIANSIYSLEYLKRNWEDVKTLDPTGYFLDTTACNQLYESYEKEKPQTKADDMLYKYKMYEFLDQQKQITGSENTGDFLIPVIHWFELQTNMERVEGETIPLWQLVFHDAAYSCQYETFRKNSPYPSWLEDMLYGYFLRFWVPFGFGEGKPKTKEEYTGWGNWDYTDESFKNTYHVDRWHEKIGMEEMTNHRFLTDDFKVEETEFGHKYKIIVNFDSKPRTIEGKTINGFDYLIIG